MTVGFPAAIERRAPIEGGCKPFNARSTPALSSCIASFVSVRDGCGLRALIWLIHNPMELALAVARRVEEFSG